MAVASCTSHIGYSLHKSDLDRDRARIHVAVTLNIIQMLTVMCCTSTKQPAPHLQCTHVQPLRWNTDWPDDVVMVTQCDWATSSRTRPARATPSSSSSPISILVSCLELLYDLWLLELELLAPLDVL